MFDSKLDEDFNEEEIQGDLLAILDDGYQELYRIYCGEFRDEAVGKLTKEEAINVIDWIERFFIAGFEQLEQYEKCAVLKEFSYNIKNVKQLI